LMPNEILCSLSDWVIKTPSGVLAVAITIRVTG
jgi:hypothetical protein